MKLSSFMVQLTQHHNRREQLTTFDVKKDDFENQNCASSQSLQIQKNQKFELLERYYNVLFVFGLNSANCVLSINNAYLLPILVNERDIEPTFSKKANQFISFKFGNIQLLDIMNFRGEQQVLIQS